MIQLQNQNIKEEVVMRISIQFSNDPTNTLLATNNCEYFFCGKLQNKLLTMKATNREWEIFFSFLSLSPTLHNQ